ncbi:MAG: CPBP family intramembrane glutamic endopeptidase [Christensenellales bacterium]|jgi:membrane protease YdiL (CAAX protease family)
MSDLFNPNPFEESEPSARPSIFTANALFLLAGVGLILVSVFGGSIVNFLSDALHIRTPVHAMIALNALYYLPFLALPYARTLARCGAERARLTGISLHMTLLCIAITPLCMFLVGSLTALWTPLLARIGIGAGAEMIPLANANELILGIFAVAVMPGIFEELLFRGVVLGAYEVGGTRRAILISTVLFATLHGSVQGLPAQLVMGAVLGYVVVATGSLYAGMMIHTAYNAMMLVINYIVASGASESAQEYAAFAASGAGVAAIIVEGLLSLALVLLVLRAFKRHRVSAGISLAPPAPLRMTAGEIILLISGAVTALFLYADNLFGILRIAA